MRITQRLRYLVYSIHMVYIHFRCEVIFGKLLLQVLKCVFSYVLVFFLLSVFFYSVQKRHGILTFRFVSVCERLLCTLCVVQCSINLFHLVILFGFDKKKKRINNKTHCQLQGWNSFCPNQERNVALDKESSISFFNFLVLMVLFFSCYWYRFCVLLFFCL